MGVEVRRYIHEGARREVIQREGRVLKWRREIGHARMPCIAGIRKEANIRERQMSHRFTFLLQERPVHLPPDGGMKEHNAQEHHLDGYEKQECM